MESESGHENRAVECRVGILARLHVIDSVFFLWTHKFQLKLTITRPLGHACIHNGVQNIPCKIIENVPFLSPKLSKYRVMCSKLAREWANLSKL